MFLCKACPILFDVLDDSCYSNSSNYKGLSVIDIISSLNLPLSLERQEQVEIRHCQILVPQILWAIFFMGVCV